ncbi:MAG: hypothetical protein J6I64_07410 [Lachnospiraceae bacterium]|nr:hypothetical protein [Lachnospiraceae bacterium]
MALIDDVKDYLGICYTDTVTDKVLTGAIERGKKKIDGYAGAEQDYETEGPARQILFDYCRYVRAHAVEMFEPNFRSEIIALREDTELRLAAEAAGLEEST